MSDYVLTPSTGSLRVHAAHREHDDPAWVPVFEITDWLLRILPATWLRAAGHSGQARALYQRPPLRHPDLIPAHLEALYRLNEYVSRELDRAWRPTAQFLARHVPDDLLRPQWQQITDATWRAATGAIAHRLAIAAHVARPYLGLADSQAVAKRLTGARDGDGTAWAPVVDVPRAAACVVAWAAVDATARRDPELLAPHDPHRAWDLAWQVAHDAAAPVLHRLDAAAVEAGINWAAVATALGLGGRP